VIEPEAEKRIFLSIKINWSTVSLRLRWLRM